MVNKVYTAIYIEVPANYVTIILDYCINANALNTNRNLTAGFSGFVNGINYFEIF
jgi:hypothetical protein